MKKIVITKIILNKAIQFTLKKTLLYFFILNSSVGFFIAKKLIQKLGFTFNTKLYKINFNFLLNIIMFLDNEILDLYTFKEIINNHYKVDNFLNNYKAKKRRLNLPVNGQRTRSNARTTRRIHS